MNASLRQWPRRKCWQRRMMPGPLHRNGGQCWPTAQMPVSAPRPVLMWLARCRWVKSSSMTFLARELVSWAQRRRRCPSRGQAFAGSSRLTCRWDPGHWRTETSALPQLCWSPTSRLGRPGNIRRAQETTGFQRCAPAWELFVLARGESVEISCSICSSSKRQEKNGRMISKQISKPTNS